MDEPTGDSAEPRKSFQTITGDGETQRQRLAGPALTQSQELLDVQITRRGALGIYLNTDNGYDYDALSAKLSEIKLRYPEKTDAAILLESEIPYDTLVQVMDRVRVEQKIEGKRILRNDLFPDISIGDAPLRDGA